MSFCYFLAIGSLPWDASCKFLEWLSLARNIIWLRIAPQAKISFFRNENFLGLRIKPTKSANQQAKMRIFLDYVPTNDQKEVVVTQIQNQSWQKYHLAPQATLFPFLK